MSDKSRGIFDRHTPKDIVTPVLNDIQELKKEVANATDPTVKAKWQKILEQYEVRLQEVKAESKRIGSLGVFENIQRLEGILRERGYLKPLEPKPPGVIENIRNWFNKKEEKKTDKDQADIPNQITGPL